MNPVLVTDSLVRKSLAAVRSLGAKGIDVYAADTTRLTPAGWSRYSRGSLRYPSHAATPERFADWVAQEAARRPGLVLMPMDDGSVSAILDHQEAILAAAPDTRWLLPDREAFMRAADKYETMRLAATLGLDAPRTWMPADEGELATIADEAGFPLVVKARGGSGSRGIRIVRDRDELLAGYREIAAFLPQPMVQEYVPLGPRFDVALLYDGQGVLVASYAQREVRHYPADIGPSTVQESVWMPELVERSATLVGALGWRGIAEVEWMLDPRDGKAKLMEINPRYWNSLHSALQSGIDFPYLHYRLALGQHAAPQHTYAIGQITRNLLPGDLLHAISTRNFKLDPPLLARGGRPIEDDILSWKDPMAAAGFAAACLRYAFDLRMWKTLIR